MNHISNLIILKKKYGNHEPYKIAKEKNALIIEENLGKQIAGYCNNTNDKKLIHVNSKIPSYCKNFVIAYFLTFYSNTCTDADNFLFLTMEKVAHLAQSYTA